MRLRSRQECEGIRHRFKPVAAVEAPAAEVRKGLCCVWLPPLVAERQKNREGVRRENKTLVLLFQQGGSPSERQGPAGDRFSRAKLKFSENHPYRKQSRPSSPTASNRSEWSEGAI